MNTNLLRAEIVKNGMSQQEFAKKLGISPKTFYRKMKKGVFGTDEVDKMVSILRIENPIEIFLSKKKL